MAVKPSIWIGCFMCYPDGRGSERKVVAFTVAGSAAEAIETIAGGLIGDSAISCVSPPTGVVPLGWREFGRTPRAAVRKLAAVGFRFIAPHHRLKLGDIATLGAALLR